MAFKEKVAGPYKKYQKLVKKKNSKTSSYAYRRLNVLFYS